MKEKIRNCRICGKEMLIKTNVNVGCRSKGEMTCFTYSDEGVYFVDSDNGRGGVWFCNDCWHEIINNYQKWKNK